MYHRIDRPNRFVAVDCRSSAFDVLMFEPLAENLKSNFIDSWCIKSISISICRFLIGMDHAQLQASLKMVTFYPK